MPKKSVTPQDDFNSDIAAHYDEEFNSPDRSVHEELAEGEENAARDEEGGHGALSRLTQKGLHDAEGGERGFLKRREERKQNGLQSNFQQGEKKPGGGVGAGGAAGAAANGLQKALQKFTSKGGGKKKKGVANAFVGMLVAMALLFGLGNLGTHELNAAENGILKWEAKVEQHMEQKLTARLFDRIVKKALQKANGTPEEKAAIAQEDAQAKANGEQITQTIDEYPMANSPELQTLLDKAGLHVELDNLGNFKGIFDVAGNDVTDEIRADNNKLQKLLNQEWEINEVETYRAVMTVEAAADWNVFPPDGSKDSNPNKTLNEAVQEGASEEQIAKAIAEENNKAPGDAKDNAEFQSQQADSEVIREGVDAANKEFEQSGDATAAEAAGVNAAKSVLNKFGNQVFIANLATTACSVQKAVQTAADDRVPQILELLIRQHAVLFSLASELNAGKLTAHTASSSIKLLQGNPGLLPNKDGTPAAGSYPFTKAAGWHRATGQPVNNNPTSPLYTPDIVDGAKPNRSSASRLVDSIQAILNLGGLGTLSCKALTSNFGVIFQAGVNIIQIVSNLGDFGATQAAVAAGSTAGIEILDNVVLPQIITTFTTLAITGTVPPVHQINNADAGADAGFSLFGRHLGGLGKTNAQTYDLRKNATAAALNIEKQQPWAYRTFSMDNPDSLAFRLFARIPFGTSSVFSGAANYFTGFPFNIFQQLSSIFTPQQTFADIAAPQICTDAYCLKTDATDDTLIDKYTPEEAEHYFKGSQPSVTNVTANGKTIRRIDALGDPETYQENQGGDPNNDDLLHCFRDSPSQLSDQSDGSHDDVKRNCGSLGTYDLTNPADDPSKNPTDDTIAGIYCKALVGSYTDAGCLAQVKPQIHDDIGHYSDLLGYFGVNKTVKSMATYTQ